MNRQRVALAVDCVKDQRHQMGFRLMKLAHLALGVGARHVEVTKDHRTQPVAGAEIGQHILNRALGRAIGVQWRLRTILIQQHSVLIAIGGAGG